MKEGLILWRHHRLYLGLWFNVKDVLLGPPGQNDVPGQSYLEEKSSWQEKASAD